LLLRNLKLWASLDAPLRETFDDYGFKILTDDDLKLLQERIGETSKENRVNLGYADFFGFSKEFFRFLKEKKRFQEVFGAAVSLGSILDRQLMDFINAKIPESIFLHITVPLLLTGRIHRFSLGVAHPYLFDRLVPRVLGSKPLEILSKYNPRFKLDKDELISEIAKTLFEISERIMKGDYSGLAGDAATVEFKKKLYGHIHEGLSSIQDARNVFDRDIVLIRPVLGQIEEEIGRLVSVERTVDIKDISFFEDKGEAKRVFDTIREVEGDHEMSGPKGTGRDE